MGFWIYNDMSYVISILWILLIEIQSVLVIGAERYSQESCIQITIPWDVH